jgi:hypothetical protein
MMVRQIEAVIIFGHAHKKWPNQRTALEIVGTPGLLGCSEDSLRLGFWPGQPAEVEDRQFIPRGGTKDLHRRAVNDAERRPQDLVTANNLIEGIAQRADVERASLAYRR